MQWQQIGRHYTFDTDHVSLHVMPVGDDGYLAEVQLKGVYVRQERGLPNLATAQRRAAELYAELLRAELARVEKN